MDREASGATLREAMEAVIRRDRATIRPMPPRLIARCGAKTAIAFIDGTRSRWVVMEADHDRGDEDPNR